MAKDDKLEFIGIVSEVLPNATFRVYIEDFDSTVLAHLGGKMKKNNINVYKNDKVTIELPIYDFSRGIITFRYKVKS